MPSFLKSITPIPLFHYHHKTTLFQQSLKHFFILTYVTLALLSISSLHFARSLASILLIIVFYARIPKSASQPRHHRRLGQLSFLNSTSGQRWTKRRIKSFSPAFETKRSKWKFSCLSDKQQQKTISVPKKSFFTWLYLDISGISCLRHIVDFIVCFFAFEF